MPKPVKKMQKANAAAQAAVLAKIPPELLDQLVKGPMTAEAVDDVSRAFKKALIERALGAEMSHHPGLRRRLGEARGGDQPPQRQERQDGSDRRRTAAHRGAARPGRRFRT